MQSRRRRAALAGNLHDVLDAAQKKGLSGTAIFTRMRPLKVTPHIGMASTTRKAVC